MAGALGRKTHKATEQHSLILSENTSNKPGYVVNVLKWLQFSKDPLPKLLTEV